MDLQLKAFKRFIGAALVLLMDYSRVAFHWSLVQETPNREFSTRFRASKLAATATKPKPPKPAIAIVCVTLVFVRLSRTD